MRLIFQDEVRFGRMAKARRCWAPAPCRPVMPNGYQRQFTYVYEAVSPHDDTGPDSISARLKSMSSVD